MQISVIFEGHFDRDVIQLFVGARDQVAEWYDQIKPDEKHRPVSDNKPFAVLADLLKNNPRS